MLWKAVRVCFLKSPLPGHACRLPLPGGFSQAGCEEGGSAPPQGQRAGRRRPRFSPSSLPSEAVGELSGTCPAVGLVRCALWACWRGAGRGVPALRGRSSTPVSHVQGRETALLRGKPAQESDLKHLPLSLPFQAVF